MKYRQIDIHRGKIEGYQAHRRGEGRSQKALAICVRPWCRCQTTNGSPSGATWNTSSYNDRKLPGQLLYFSLVINLLTLASPAELDLLREAFINEVTPILGQDFILHLNIPIPVPEQCLMWTQAILERERLAKLYSVLDTNGAAVDVGQPSRNDVDLSRPGQKESNFDNLTNSIDRAPQPFVRIFSPFSSFYSREFRMLR